MINKVNKQTIDYTYNIHAYNIHTICSYYNLLFIMYLGIYDFFYISNFFNFFLIENFFANLSSQHESPRIVFGR